TCAGSIALTASIRRTSSASGTPPTFIFTLAAVEMAAHLVLQIFYGLARRIPATADITEYLAHDLAAVVPLGQQAMKRFSGYLGDCVPDRDLDRPDADRALAVPAGFFPLHHDGENFRWIEILLVLVEQQ